jgi:uncharacterized protein YndB with AHSA1/START domain
MNAALAATAAVVVRRTIAATAEELFDAWLDPQAMAIWMRPGSIQTTTAKVDARVGGRYEIVMHSATETYPHTGVYRVIDRPRRLVFTWISRGTEQRDSLVTVDFLTRGAGTEVVVNHEQLPEGARPSHNDGWTSALQRLEEACQQWSIQQ